MARNLYILAGSLLLFALISCGMIFVGSQYQQSLPANGTLWKTLSLLLLLGGLIVAFLAVMTQMFEQVDRRARERQMRARTRRK